MKIKWDGDKFLQKYKQKQRKNMLAACEFVGNYIKESFGFGTSGYRAYKRGRHVHWSSIPGEPPNVDTGALRNSITYELIEKNLEIIGRIGTNLNYGFWLEKGTDKMQARPYLEIAVQKNASDIAKLLKRK